MTIRFTTSILLASFPVRNRFLATGDIHCDFQLLYTILVDVARVIRLLAMVPSPLALAKKLRHTTRKHAPQTSLLYIHNVLPSCQFEWCAPDNTWLVFLGDFLDRKRAEHTVAFETNVDVGNGFVQNHAEIHLSTRRRNVSRRSRRVGFRQLRCAPCTSETEWRKGHQAARQSRVNEFARRPIQCRLCHGSGSV